MGWLVTVHTALHVIGHHHVHGGRGGDGCVRRRCAGDCRNVVGEVRVSPCGNWCADGDGKFRWPVNERTTHAYGVVITGGTRGLGLAMARRFRQLGDNVRRALDARSVWLTRRDDVRRW